MDVRACVGLATTMTDLHTARGPGRLSIKYELLLSWYGENVPELFRVKDMSTEGDANESFDDDRPILRLTCPVCLRWMRELDALPPTAKPGAR